MKPVLPILVAIASAASAAAEPWDFSAGPPAALPALTRYEAPVFPATLRATPVTDGYATVIFTVREDGHIDDALALEASDPAFADATLDAVSQWRLATAHSTTLPRREMIQFDYRRSGTIASLSHSEASKAAFMAAAVRVPAIRTLEWEVLDDTPRRIAGVMPMYPEQLRARPLRGYATVDFVIDSTGNVRVATVTGSTAPEFADAALAAVKQWRFEPPRQDGNSVNVRSVRSFTFGPLATRDRDTAKIARNP
ncbi:MAG TPA: energy transducer TonB [Povalibacter sp.]|nr:energy transducer TonB [Povalibacter sp.]